MWVIRSLRFGSFNVGVGVVEPAVGETQLCQGSEDPKLLIMPVERTCDPEGSLEVVDCLLHFALGIIYIAEDAVAPADPEFFAFIREQLDRSGCGFFGSIELLVAAQQSSQEFRRL